jgi:hypothetical protein
MLHLFGDDEKSWRRILHTLQTEGKPTEEEIVAALRPVCGEISQNALAWLKDTGLTHDVAIQSALAPLGIPLAKINLAIHHMRSGWTKEDDQQEEKIDEIHMNG